MLTSFVFYDIFMVPSLAVSSFLALVLFNFRPTLMRPGRVIKRTATLSLYLLCFSMPLLDCLENQEADCRFPLEC
jgi:hypothetical protein